MNEITPIGARWRQRLVEGAALGALLAACSGDPPLAHSSESGSLDAGSGWGDAVVPGDAAANEGAAGEWSPCSAFTDDQDEDAQCITVRYPMRRTVTGAPSQDGTRLDVFFKRFPASEALTGQVWLLAGGPGSPGATLEPLAMQIQETHPSVEVYLPDHRGTGRSTLFDCLESRGSFGRGELAGDVFLQACSDELVEVWGEDLSFVSVTEAAYDVTAMMQATARPDVPIIAIGGSYGGYWLHRVLQVGGSVIGSAIFDSPLRPIGGLSAVDLMLEPEQAGLALLDLCARDPQCGERLGDDPARRALDILEGGGTCRGIVEAGVTRAWLQYVFAEALERHSFRGLVPPVLHRLERCDLKDVEFILAFGEAVLDRPSAFDGILSSAPPSVSLAFHINLSEIFNEPATVNELVEASNGSIFGSAGPALANFEGEEHWHRYEPDEWVGQWADTSPNVLILQGSFDSITPPRYARELAQQFSGPNHYYFEVDHASHIALATSHEVDQGLTCGMHIVDQFLRDPQQPPDGDCASDAPPFVFGADDELLLDLVGHTNVWDNPPSGD